MTTNMDQKETLRLLVQESSAKLRRATGGISDELFWTRPGPSLNPIGFIYFNVLRNWNWALNVLCREQPPENDAWHRAGLSGAMGYEPLGRGINGRGIGVGYSDTDVDTVPKRRDVLVRYHDLLDAETSDYIGDLTTDELNRERTNENAQSRLNPFTPAGLLSIVVLHNAEHAGDIKFIKGMHGMPDPTYPGKQSRPDSTEGTTL